MFADLLQRPKSSVSTIYYHRILRWYMISYRGMLYDYNWCDKNLCRNLLNRIYSMIVAYIVEKISDISIQE